VIAEMRIDFFRYEFKRIEGLWITPDWMLFRKPLELWNKNTGEVIRFKTFEAMLDYELEDATMRQRIGAMPKLPTVMIDGGRGSSSTMRSFRFTSAGGNSDNTKSLLPAYANVRIKTKTEEGAMAEFASRFKNANKEWAYVVDSQGFVHSYKEGNAHSVSFNPGEMRNMLILHNHPSGGAFSDADLITTATTGARGIVASGKRGDYVFRKGSHFKASAFVKAVQTARMSGTSYDEAVDRWLKANQRKYGYKYHFAKA
jgi:hypothetical protein